MLSWLLLWCVRLFFSLSVQQSETEKERENAGCLKRTGERQASPTAFAPSPAAGFASLCGRHSTSTTHVERRRLSTTTFPFLFQFRTQVSSSIY
ncbi:unnamed protein product [Toxocara canis]|uniref:Secreted protein n=1 Tax=Toxocara canis TaxID=6265 RepID=A0A183UGE1_TOXCA|nr:unnamed protein product [Toxocara canis]